MSILISLQSPWAGLDGGPKAKAYLKNCIRECIARDEIPWASHAMFAWTEALYESDDEQREEGLILDRTMMLRVDKAVFYIDYGMSKGMTRAWQWAGYYGKPREKRMLYGK